MVPVGLRSKVLGLRFMVPGRLRIRVYGFRVAEKLRIGVYGFRVSGGMGIRVYGLRVYVTEGLSVTVSGLPKAKPQSRNPKPRNAASTHPVRLGTGNAQKPNPKSEALNAKTKPYGSP